MLNKPLISARHLCKRYKERVALDDLSFDLFFQETLGLVGESGSGKSTVGRLLLGIEEPTGGEILFNGLSLSTLSSSKRKELKKEIQIIFQDPYSSLNPRMTLGEILKEPFIIHRTVAKKNRQEEVEKLLKLVGLDLSFASRYPHEISGGQRQRIGIARALALSPRFIVCDEPLSALDVSVQAQIVTLLQTLQRERGLTYLFISHDLSLVKYLCTRVAVIYRGRAVEIAPTQELYASPCHPYTQLLLSSIFTSPLQEKRAFKEEPAPLASPSAHSLKRKGCPFAPRCPFAIEKCLKELPLFKEVSKNHFASCHLF